MFGGTFRGTFAAVPAPVHAEITKGYGAVLATARP